MSDLTKLTRYQLGATEWSQIRRRLERLEQCEAALESIAAGELGPERIARAALEEK